MAFEKHARTVTLLTLLSRFSGLARDAVQSRVFGAGPVMGAFAFAFQVPNLFRRLFGEGALTASFVPIYTRLDRDDPALARTYAGTLLSLLTILLSAITLVGVVVALALPVTTDSGAMSRSSAAASRRPVPCWKCRCISRTFRTASISRTCC